MELYLTSTLKFVLDPQCSCMDCAFFQSSCDCPMIDLNVRVCDKHKGYWTIKSINTTESVNPEPLITRESSKTDYFY